MGSPTRPVELPEINISLPERFWQYLGLGLVLAVFAYVQFRAIRAGRELAETQYLAAAGNQLARGVELFYKDQGRYPSDGEFADSAVMLTYFDRFPPASFSAAGCGQNYYYQRKSLSSYSLYVCVPRAAGGLSAGWNEVQRPQ